MVRGRVRVLYFLFLIQIFFGMLAEAAELRVIADKSQVEIGKYLSVRIVYKGESVPDKNHLEDWYADFFVELRDTEAENLPAGFIQYTEFLRLYPRSAGHKILSSIALGGAIARPVRIEVKSLLRDAIDATPRWQSLPESLWQGETIKVSIVQNLLHPSNQVVVEEGLFPGFFLQGREQLLITHNNLTQVQLNWLITAQRPGVFQLDLPAIVQRGRGRWRFYLPRAEITVKPLPGYIPATVPVGKVSVQTGVFYKNKQPVWFIELHSNGPLPEDIYGIRTQLSILTGLPVESIERFIKSSDHHRYQFPVPDWSWGTGDGSQLIVSYFDVLDGELKTVSKRLPAVWNIPELWRYILLVLLVLLLVTIIWFSIKLIRNIILWQQYRSLLKQTVNSHELRRMLLAQGNFCTLDAWSEFIHSPKKTIIVRQIVRQLNECCFARSTKIVASDIQTQIINLHTFRYWMKINNK